MDTAYNGWVKLTDDEMSDFYEGNLSTDQFYENEYVFCGKEVYRVHNSEFERVSYPTINNQWCGTLRPLDRPQYALMDLLSRRDVPIKLCLGLGGSGKDALMFNAALNAVDGGDFDKIVFIRPNFTLRNVPEIGYLPSDMQSKLAWTMSPLYDKVGGAEGVQMLIDQRKLEMSYLGFIRGMSFNRTIVYITEGQNMDVQTVKTLIARIGEGSELWINGDSAQTDSKAFDKSSGVVAMEEDLRGEPLFGYIYLPETHRSEVAKLAGKIKER